MSMPRLAPISPNPLFSVVMRVYNERTTVQTVIPRVRHRVYEVPITYAGRGYDEGKTITWTAGCEALWVLLEYRFVE